MSKINVTAGIIVIGDEILKGVTKEINSLYASQKLFNMGVHLLKISTIGDDLQQISSEVKNFSQAFTYVLTSGGIGSTHDDITYKGVADAFGQPLEANPKFVDFLSNYKTNYKNKSYFKMALIPESSTLHFSPTKNKFPLVQTQNVFIMPGIPHLFEKAFEVFKEFVVKEQSENLSQFYFDAIYLPNTYETSIAERLTQINDKYSTESSLKIGSYPEMENENHWVKLTVFSTNKTIFQQVLTELKQTFHHEVSNSDLYVDPKATMTNGYHHSTLKHKDKSPHQIGNGLLLIEEIVQLFPPGTTINIKLNETLTIFDEVLKNYKFPDEIAVAFNGGKDCCVMLYLWLSYLKSKSLLNSPTSSKNNSKILTTLYIRQKSPFPEVEQFIYESSCRYKLNLKIIEGNYKDALHEFKSFYPHVKSILMGTRRSDPYSKVLHFFTPTDEGWPHIMRIHPILDWFYNEIWQIIDTIKIPYCLLYDKGYSSLGNMYDTFPNPKLRFIDSHGMVSYKAARELENGEEAERIGRTMIRQ